MSDEGKSNIIEWESSCFIREIPGNEVDMQYILIADDNHDITDVLSAYARKDEFEPVIAHDGEEALRLFQPLPPDCFWICVMQEQQPFHRWCCCCL